MTINASYTKSGPGRRHLVGPGPKRVPPQLDDLGKEWHLSDHAIRERVRANARREQRITTELPRILQDLGITVLDESADISEEQEEGPAASKPEPKPFKRRI